MDFKFVLEKLLGAFNERHVHYALIGGFALGLLGIGRTTVDLDFLINNEDISKIDDLYKKLKESAGR